MRINLVFILMRIRKLITLQVDDITWHTAILSCIFRLNICTDGHTDRYYLLNYSFKGKWRNCCTFLYLGTRWELFVSRPYHFTPEEIASGTHWTGDWLDSDPVWTL
jgi:hypothetical protein